MAISKYIIVMGDKAIDNANTFEDAKLKAVKWAQFSHRTAFIFCGLEKYAPSLKEIDDRLHGSPMTLAEVAHDGE